MFFFSSSYIIGNHIGYFWWQEIEKTITIYIIFKLYFLSKGHNENMTKVLLKLFIF